MTSPDLFSDEEAATARFDNALRHQLTDFEAVPAPAAWETLRMQLPAPRPTSAPWRARLGLFAGGVAVGALLWWGSGEPGRESVAPPTLVIAADTPVATAVEAPATVSTLPLPLTAPAAPVSKRRVAGKRRPTVRPATVVIAEPFIPASEPAPAVSETPTLVNAPAPAVSPASTVIVTSNTVVGAANNTLVATATTLADASARQALPNRTSVEARDSLIRREVRTYLNPVSQALDTSRVARLRALVAEQTRALMALTARLDSVRNALPEAPASPAKAK